MLRNDNDPAFLPGHYSNLFQKRLWVLNLDFDVHASWELNALQAVDGLRVWIHDVDEALVNAHLEMLAGVLVNVGSADDRKAMLVGR